jgi:hypothetical protein
MLPLLPQAAKRLGVVLGFFQVLHSGETAYAAGKLQFFGEIQCLRDPQAFANLAALRKSKWVVYAKPPFGFLPTLTGRDLRRCPRCGVGILAYLQFLRRRGASPGIDRLGCLQHGPPGAKKHRFRATRQLR